MPPDEAHDFEMRGDFTLSFSMRWAEPEVVWLIGAEGHTPIVLANTRSVLVDRNIISTLRLLQKEPTRPTLRAERWWLGHLNSSQFELNPLLFAYEGGARRLPGREEFDSSMRSATAVLHECLPRARVTQHLQLGMLYDILREWDLQHERCERFLLTAAPLLAPRHAQVQRRAVEQRLVDLAMSASVDLTSLVFLAALSCLYEKADGDGPLLGRRVLNPKEAYTPMDAYRALADLRALELLAGAIANGFLEQALATRDRYLAGFWCALRVTAPPKSQLAKSFQVSPRQDLFPSLDRNGVAQLVARLSRGKA